MTDQPVETMAPPGTGSGRLSAFLSGIGYYRLSVRRRKILSIVFSASLAVHIVGLMVAGVWAITHSPSEEVTIFTTPPPVRTYEPRKLEHRVKVKKRQRSSSRPSMVPRLVSTKLSDVPEKLTVPARSSVSVTAKGTKLNYSVKNFLTKPKQGLLVEIALKAE